MELIVIGGLVLAGYAALWVAMQRKLDRTVAELRREWEAELRAGAGGGGQQPASAVMPVVSTAAVTAGEVVSAGAAVPVPVAEVARVAAMPAKVGAKPAAAKHPEVTPEILLMIAAAVTTYLGKKVRIRSAKLVSAPFDFVNPWAQQGRVFVQASHNLMQRVH